MGIKRFISVMLIFVLMTEIILGASSAYGMEMPMKEVLRKEVGTTSQDVMATELSKKIKEYITDESTSPELVEDSMDIAEKEDKDNGMGEDTDIPKQNYEDIQASSLLNLNAPLEDGGNTSTEEGNKGTKSIFTLTGYVAPDFTAIASVNSGFKVEILGTEYSTETNEDGFFTISGSVASQGKYILQITKSSFLKRQVGDLSLRGIVTVGAKDAPVKMWAGDIPKNDVQDDTINMSDVIQIAVSFGKLAGGIGFNKGCDLNDDNSINMSDVIIMARHFNATSASYDKPEVSVIIDDEKPSVPQNLKSLWNTGASISLEWQKSTDNISVDKYEIYCNDKLIAATKETSLVCNGMIPNKMNTICVKAVDPSGNISDSSNILKIQAPEDDYGDSKENATPIELENVISGTMTNDQDVDCFAFEVKNSGTYAFKKFNTMGLKHFLYDSNDKEVVSGVNGLYEYNLEAGKRYYLKTKYDLFTINYSFIICPKTAKPELIISGISTKTAYLDQPLNIELNLINVGNIDCTSKFRIMVDIDGQNNAFWADVDSTIYVDLKNKISVTGGIDGSNLWVPHTLGKHSIKIHVDYDNSISEINENNNTFEFQFAVDDTNINYGSAKQILLESEIEGELYGNVGEDYYYFIPAISGKYRFEMPSPQNATFYVYDKNEKQLVATTRLLDQNSVLLYYYVECEFNAGEKYYISVEGDEKYSNPEEKYKIISYNVTPDLAINGLSPLDITVDSDTQPYVYIKNEGNGHLNEGNGFRVKVYIKELNKTVYTDYYRTELKKGDETRIAIDSSLFREMSSKKGIYNIQLSIEKEKEFLELDYNNNVNNYSLNVGNADLFISEIIQPFDSIVNSPLDIRVKIKNQGVAETNGSLPIKAGVELNGDIYYTDEYIGKIKPNESVTLAVYNSNKLRPVISSVGDYDIKADLYVSDKMDDARNENNSLNAKLTIDKVPDLTVSEIQMTPSDMSQGDKVLFSAEIKNIGEGKIGNGKAIRVGFKIDDGDTILWSESFSSGLNPGEKIKIMGNDGIDGDRWSAFEGEHTITAIVDDLGFFTESDESNNILTEKFVVKGKCDLLVENITIDPPNPVIGDKVVLKAQVTNASDSASPFGRLYKVGFKINDSANVYWADSFRGIIEGNGYHIFTTERDKDPLFWTPDTEGNFKITAIIDRANEINEIDESNNILDKSVKVTKDRAFDEEADYDDDGIKNGIEKNIGTDPNRQDSDSDSISDGDEVNGMNGFVTDPLNPDMDEDGVYDGEEIKLGKSPVEKNEYTPFLVEARTQSDSVVVEVYGNAGLEVCPIKINELDNSVLKSTEGIIGDPVEVSLEGHNIQQATITFNYNELKLDGISEDELTIYWVDYDNNRLVPLPDYAVDVDKYNNCITGRVTHFSTYVPGKKNMSELKIKKDTVFTIDESGSMDSSDDVKARTGIPLKVIGNMGDMNSNFAVVKFTEQVKRLINLTNDKNDIVTALNSGIGGGATDIKRGLEESEKILLTSKNRRYIILLSDGGDNCNSYSELIKTVKRMAQENIKVFCVSLGYSTSLMDDIADITDGCHFTLNTSLKGSDLEAEINDIAEKLKDIIESEEDKPKEKKGPAKKIPSTIPNETFGCINWAGDIDAYEFTPAETKLYCISSIGETDTEINIYDSKGKLISSSDSNDDSEWDKNFYMLMNLTKGQKYRFEVSHSDLLNGTGEYKICVSDPIKKKLGPDQAYLKLLAYEMEGEYVENPDNGTVDVIIDEVKRTFRDLSFVNGQVAVDIKDFTDAFGIFEMYAAPNPDDTTPKINIEDLQMTLSGLGCEKLVTLYMEGSKLNGKVTTRAIKNFQKKFMGRLEKTSPVNVSGTFADGKLDDETNKELLEYNGIRKINSAFLKNSGASARAYLETVYKLTSENGYTLSFDGKNIVIIGGNNAVNRANKIFIPELDYKGKEKKCYAKIRNIKIAYANYLNDNYGSQDVYDTKVNMLKLMGKQMKSGQRFDETDLKNSIGGIDAYWDDKFEKAVNNYVKAALFTDVYNTLCNGKYGKYGNLKNNDVKALFLKHWTDIEVLRSPVFAEYPAPAKWYSIIPEVPTKDNGILIDKYNKGSSVSAKEYYDSYYLPLDKIRNWQGSDVGLRSVWLMATYGVTGAEMGGVLGGALSALKDYPETVKEIFTSIWAMLKNPKNTLDTIGFLCKVLWPVGFSEEKEMFINALKDMVTAFIEEFKNADSYGKGKKIGEAIIFVSSFFVSGTGIVKSLKILDILKKNKVISQVYSKVAKKSIANKEALAKMLSKMAEGVELLKTYLNTRLDSLFEIVEETKDLGTRIWYKLRKEKTEIELEKKDLTPDQCSGSLTGCFTGDTLVKTKTGLKRIDEIVEGEFVLAKDIKTGMIDYRQVLYVYKKATKEFVHINTGDDMINTTPGHLFFTNSGWWVAADNLRAGDKVLTASGEMKEIVSVESEITVEPERIYNLNVADYHTYFVGSIGLLVHNTDGCSKMIANIIRRTKGFMFFLSRADAENWAKGIFDKWRNTLSKEEINAFWKYTGEDCVENINNVLRGVETIFEGNNAQYVELLTKAINRTNLPENVVLFRGTTKEMLGELINLPVKQWVGKNISDKGFMSTSLLRDGAFNRELNLIIKAPKGTKGAFIGDMSQHADEVEVLLDKGQEMIITDILESTSTKTTIVVELLP